MERNTIRKKIFIAIKIIIGSIALIYLGFTIYFTNHFYFNTVINGKDYSNKTEKQAEEFIVQKTKNYSLIIKGREEIEDTISGEHISLNYTSKGDFAKIIKEQSPFLWIASLLSESAYEIPLEVTYEEVSFLQKVEDLVFWEAKNSKIPKDAYVGSYQAEEKKYSIVPEELGSELEKEVTIIELKKSIMELAESMDLEEKGCYIEPQVKQDDKTLQRAIAILNKYVQAEITYQLIEGMDTVAADKIQEWIFIEEGNISLDEESIRTYINSLAKEYDTYGKKRTFLTTDGRELELPSGGFGWKINRAEETQALISHIKSGEIIKKEPIYTAEGAVRKKDDIGSTYVEIDLGKQHLYLYEDGAVILETDFVSGNMIKGWGTPAGVFGLTYKTRDAVLRGESYNTPVKYWMPFNGNVGMHDAKWRKSFGGETFIAGGSHGCINLPVQKAEEIYKFVYKGVPVVCYYD